MCTFVAIGGGGGLNNQVQPNLLLSYNFAQINLHFRYENNPIPTNFWLFARMTMKYLWMGWMCMLRINHSIPMYIHTGDI